MIGFGISLFINCSILSFIRFKEEKIKLCNLQSVSNGKLILKHFSIQPCPLASRLPQRISNRLAHHCLLFCFYRKIFDILFDSTHL